MPTLEIKLLPGDIVDLWARPARGGCRWKVTLDHDSDAYTELAGENSDDFQRASYRARMAGTVTASWAEDSTTVSLVYAYTPARVFTDGVRLLWTTDENKNGGKRYHLHLQPPWGWMNDPNGLVEVHGVCHAFYQHYPHARRWNTMHWGHAVSSNLIDWVHLPIFLDPRPALLADDLKTGGAFSGSITLAEDSSFRVFYTDREDDRLPNWEWQIAAHSADKLCVDGARPIITERPPLPGLRRDMRDPYVFRGPDGLWKLLLGGGDANGGLILLYESEHPDGTDGWRFVSPLHSEPMRPGIPVECPCMMALEGEGAGLHVLVFGLLGQRDEITRRRNLSYALVGRFDGKRFEVIARRELDFATDSYAFQGFHHGNHGPIGLAWAANWTDVFKDRDYPTAMTFPRRLIWRDGNLFTPPLETVKDLREASILEQPSQLTEPLDLPRGLAEIELEFAARDTDFAIEFEHPTYHLGLVSKAGQLELLFDPPGTRSVPRYSADGAAVRKLRIFIDVGLIEIYADDGRCCATKRIDSDEPVTALHFLTNPATLAVARGWALRPAAFIPIEL
ncbi:beta-fructofuranosidase [Labrys miyagiensis]|uniref:beta-fructofuranosidase n=1 Tax=Labrys miyagiensis TaxID=346912 RepID=A0ABQ6CSN6_9HYPH|nr:GH32 C-terminal domain-containing protein [Labrys miyagiensis]GLS23373.1 beta-fructofuranosidase [Labrys miyagiensis]